MSRHARPSWRPTPVGYAALWLGAAGVFTLGVAALFADSFDQPPSPGAARPAPVEPKATEPTLHRLPLDLSSDPMGPQPTEEPPQATGSSEPSPLVIATRSPQERRTAPRPTTESQRPAAQASPDVVAPTVAAQPPPVPDPVPVEPEPQPQPAATDGILELVNRARTDAGCLPLSDDPELTAFAANWANTQAAEQRMSHSSGPYAENVAYGYETAAAVFDGWMSSPGHRVNILECVWTRHGIGAAVGQDGRIYWTQVFAT